MKPILTLILAAVMLTSVRRTLTDLMNEGLLVKTGHRRKGAFGVENCEYKLNTKDK